MPSGFQAFGSAEGYVGSSPAFTPASLAGVAGWYRADLGITLVSGKVSEWDNQIAGDANTNLVQASAGNRPTYSATDAAYNNQPTMSFVRASSQSLVSGTWATPISMPWTIFLVGNDDGSANLQIYAEGDISGSARNFFASNNPGATDYDIYAGVDLAQVGAVSSSPRVLGAIGNGGTSKLYNSAKTPVATGNSGAGVVSALSVAAGNAAFFLNGKVAEVVVCAGAMATVDVNALLDYFGTRYGITIGA